MSKLKINVGCGRTPIDGWQNFDNTISVWLPRYPLMILLLKGLKLLNNSQIKLVEFK